MADLLASSDLSIQTALNLDGGASTGMYLHTGNQNVTIDSVTTLPIVIIIK
jgi:exopolysaccharide biosynthesis protein